MLNFKKIILASLLLPVTAFCSGVFSYDNLGYRTALGDINYISVASGFSAFFNPDDSKSDSQLPLYLSLSTGQRYRVQNRVFVGYEFLLSHLGYQKFDKGNGTVSDRVIEAGMLGTISLFFNPYIDTHVKMGVGYQNHSYNDLSMSGANGILGIGAGIFVSSSSQINFDATYFSGRNTKNSTQSFSSFALGYNYYF